MVGNVVRNILGNNKENYLSPEDEEEYRFLRNSYPDENSQQLMKRLKQQNR